MCSRPVVWRDASEHAVSHAVTLRPPGVRRKRARLCEFFVSEQWQAVHGSRQCNNECARLTGCGKSCVCVTQAISHCDYVPNRVGAFASWLHLERVLELVAYSSRACQFSLHRLSPCFQPLETHVRARERW